MFGGAEEDEFMEERQKVMLEQDDAELSSSSDEDGVTLNVGLAAEDDQDDQDDQDEQDDDDDSTQDKDNEPEFGYRKKDYYGADNADYELMSSEEEEENLRDEEEAVLELQRTRRAGLVSADFVDAAAATAADKSLFTSKNTTLIPDHDLQPSIEEQALLPDNEKLELMKVSAPEVIKLAADLNKYNQECLELVEDIKAGPTAKSSYDYRLLQYHYHLRASYCTNILYFLRLRADGAPTKAHPVVETLVSLRAELDSPGEMATALKRYRASGSGGFMALPPPVSKPVLVNEKIVAEEIQPLPTGTTGDVDPHGERMDESLDEDVESAVSSEGDDLEHELLRPQTTDVPESGRDVDKLSRQRALNSYINQVEQETARERARQSGAVDDEPDALKFKTNASKKKIITGGAQMEEESASDSENPNLEVTEDGEDDDEDIEDESSGVDEDTGDGMNAKARRRLARKGLSSNQSGHNYAFKDEIVDTETRRGASTQILQNRGLTPRRSKSRKNPRVKHRGKYAKAVSRRRGAVREYRGGSDPSSYGGETTGINVRASKSVKLSR